MVDEPRHRDVWEFCIINTQTGLPSNGGPPRPDWCPLAKVVEEMLDGITSFLGKIAPQIYRAPTKQAGGE
jgi:hypothetical protein